MDEFKFFNISSPSLFCPILSRFSMRSLQSSYSTRSCTLFSETSVMISFDVQVLFTIVMKYLVNLNGISLTGCLNISSITCVKALIKSLQQIIRAFCWFTSSVLRFWGCSAWFEEDVADITSFKSTRESTRLSKSPSLSC